MHLSCLQERGPPPVATARRESGGVAPFLQAYGAQRSHSNSSRSYGCPISTVLPRWPRGFLRVSGLKAPSRDDTASNELTGSRAHCPYFRTSNFLQVSSLRVSDELHDLCPTPSSVIVTCNAGHAKRRSAWLGVVASYGFAFRQLPEQSKSEDVSLSMPITRWPLRSSCLRHLCFLIK